MTRQQDMTLKPIRIGLADKSPLMRAAIKHLLADDRRFDIVSENETSEALLESLEKVSLDVVVVGWVIPPGDARFLLDHLQTMLKAPRVVVYTGLEGESVPMQVMAHGGAAFVSKNEEPEQLLDTIVQVAKGHMVFPYLDVSQIHDNPLATLTKREAELYDQTDET